MDFLFENIVVALTIMVLTYVLFKLPQKIHFSVTKDEIDNEKMKKNYLKKKYNEEYPDNDGIEINRPRKKDDDWVVHIYNFSKHKKEGYVYEFSRNGWVGSEIRINITFIEGLHDKIEKESTWIFNKEDGNEKLTTFKKWDKDGNEIECK